MGVLAEVWPRATEEPSLSTCAAGLAPTRTAAAPGGWETGSLQPAETPGSVQGDSGAVEVLPR